MTTDIRGASTDAVEHVIETGAPVSGLDGFGGCLPDGRLVRDVVGRVPVYRDQGGGDWAFDPREVDVPEPVPAGCVMPVAGGPPTRRLSLPRSKPRSESTALTTLEEAIETQLTALESMPVAFSGGVDSALLTAGTDGPLYCVGFPDSPDRETANATAAQLDRSLEVVDLDAAAIETVLPTVARAINRTDAMSLSIAIPFYLLARAVGTDGYDRIALGQGADELFAGYEKLLNPADDPRLTADAIIDGRDELLTTIPRQVERDVNVFRAADLTPVTPWLSDAVIRAAMRLPESLLIADGTRKVAFRTVATEHLPTSITDTPKRAIQYGSRTARELDRLARDAGFNRRIGDHVSKYIASRVQDLTPLPPPEVADD